MIELSECKENKGMFQLLNLDEQFDLDSFLNISQYQARIHSESL